MPMTVPAAKQVVMMAFLINISLESVAIKENLYP